MPQPTEAELQTALKAAARMRETGQDPLFLGKALLHCHYLNGLLEEVLTAAEAYLRSGMAEREHARLEKAVERVRAAERRAARQEPPPLGL